MDMLWDLFGNFSFGTAHLEVALQLAALTCILITVQVFQDWKKDTLVVLSWPRLVRDGFIALLVCLIVLYGEFGGRPFIYFQF